MRCPGSTRTDVPQRGGALTSEFDLQDSLKQGPTEWGTVSEEKMWANIEHFLKAIVPVAEKAKVRLAAHPDDPPVSPLRGIGRILTSAENYRRVMRIVPSPVNGVTFCQANFKAMGEDVFALAAEWCREGKVFFVHFRASVPSTRSSSCAARWPSSGRRPIGSGRASSVQRRATCHSAGAGRVRGRGVRGGREGSSDLARATLGGADTAGRRAA